MGERRQSGPGSGGRRVSAIPGPLRRLGRERTRLIAVGLLALVALSASGVQSAAAAALQNTLNANWRGAYDILVTAKGAAVGTDGLLAPNSLGSGTHGMTLAELAKVRKISGIDVAAPIGGVLIPLLNQTPTVGVPVAALGAKSEPQAFRFTLSYSTDDGISKRYVAGSTGYVVIDQGPIVATPVLTGCNLNGFDVDTAKYPVLCQGIQPSRFDAVTVTDESEHQWGQGAETQHGVTYFDPSETGTPTTSTLITLVDPVAERKLLGKAGSFLKPLEEIAPKASTSRKAMDAWAKSSKSTYASDYLKQRAAGGIVTDPDSPEFTKELAAFNKEHHVDTATDEAVYVPLLTAKPEGAPLSMSITVQSVGSAPRTDSSWGAFPYAINLGTTGKDLGTSSTDASALLNPFVRTPVTVPWPGTTPDPSRPAGPYATLSVGAAGTVSGSKYSVTKHSDGSATATLGASGYVQPIPAQDNGFDPFQAAADPAAAGVESSYSFVTRISQPPNSGGQLAVPVGNFSTTQLRTLQSSLSYVPLGAYQPVASTVATASGSRKLQPSVSGLGLVSPATVAIASIASAPAWSQNAPISSIRVRVAGISGYSRAAEEKVLDVAEKIRKLGLATTVVAGSSPVDVKVAVSGYAFGVTEPTQKQRIGDLGSVTQRWSELGAAARADVAISTASLSIVGIALGSTALLLGAVQFVSVPRRRAQATVLREIGWTRGRVRRWMAAEEVPVVVVVAAAGLAAVGLSNASRLSVQVAGVGVIIVLATSMAAVVAGSVAHQQRQGASRARVGRRRLLVRGRSPITFGIRQTRIHLFTTVVLLIANLIVAVSAAALVELFLSGRRAAGASLLAQFTTAQSAAPQIVLGVIGLVAGIALALLMRRMDLMRRAPQWRAMRAMGWTTPDLRAVQRVEALGGSIPALILAILVCGGGAILLHVTPLWLFTLIGAVASVLASAVITFTQPRESRA